MKKIYSNIAKINKFISKYLEFCSKHFTDNEFFKIK